MSFQNFFGMAGYDSAMASGATGSDPARNAGSPDAAMPAAPTTPSKRPAAAGGSSPKYLKRAARRELVGQLAATPTVSHEQLAAEVHRHSEQATWTRRSSRALPARWMCTPKLSSTCEPR